jgi:sulfotransferase 6B1
MTDLTLDDRRRNDAGRAPLRLPPVFLNSVPKSGTHLAVQILGAVPGLTAPRDAPFFEGLPHQRYEDRDRLARIAAGNLGMGYGHVYFSPNWVAMLD